MERANPNSGTFTSTTGAANVGTAAVSATGPTSATYDFSITFERSAPTGMLITTSLKRTSDSAELGGLTGVLDSSALTYVFNRVGFQATTGLNADQIQMTNVDVTFAAAAAPLPMITASGFVEGAFHVSVEGMEPATTYVLKRSPDLLSFPDTVGDTFTGAATHTFIDPSPPAGKAFYRIEVAP